MANQQPTLLITCCKRTYLFDENGAWDMPSAQFDFEDLFFPDTPPGKLDRMWSLLDSPWSEDEHSDNSM
ncbi:hypothetical protein CVT26_003563 [Gymnopilus dilepis]|uniref:Uncharacterized protein n=1 Tax=Gymnopilus dilepis TaxID=231916 RepID=A0A409VS58_9AGAR|nr:hypothetical protein CVT26_003563 [Gymnopilus dilepis]